MKLWNPRRRRVGSVAIRSDRLFWMTAETQRNRWSPLAGGVVEFDPMDGPQPELLAEVWGSRSIEWGLVVPAFAHAGLFTLPPLAESELARGIQWQLEKAFSIDSAQSQFDYELLPAERSLSFHGRAAVVPNALMVALPREGLDQWIQWASRLPYPPRRLEPTSPSLLRAIRNLPQFASTPGAIWVHRDSGGTVMIVSASGQCLALRELGPEHGSKTDPFSEEGTPRLRELLLYSEDRYPELEISHLFGLGDIDADRLATVADELRLESGPSLPPPFECPPQLVPNDGWIVPFGNLLEVGTHE